MDIKEMLAQLHTQRDQIIAAISVIERLSGPTVGVKRRGRPPKSAAGSGPAPVKGRGRPPKKK